jgi:hypothetical protein
MRGIRSDLIKICLVAPNEEMAKSVSRKIEWLASFGSLLRLDAVSVYFQSSMICGNNTESKKGSTGRKTQNAKIKVREAKIERHSKPKSERSKRESKLRKKFRESLLDKHSRPKSQRR